MYRNLILLALCVIFAVSCGTDSNTEPAEVEKEAPATVVKNPVTIIQTVAGNKSHTGRSRLFHLVEVDSSYHDLIREKVLPELEKKHDDKNFHQYILFKYTPEKIKLDDKDFIGAFRAGKKGAFAMVDKNGLTDDLELWKLSEEGDVMSYEE